MPSAISLLITLVLLLMPLESVAASPLPIPTAPSNLTAVYYPPLTARLRWKDNSNNETSFLLNVKSSIPSDNSQCPDCVRVWMDSDLSFVLNANSTTVDFKMQYGGKYTFSIQAKGKDGTSSKTNAVTVHAPPIPPSTLTVTKANNNYNAKWKDNSNNEGINVVAIGYPGGIRVFGYKPNTTTAAIPASAIPASAIPASAKLEFLAAAIPASAIPASFKKNGDALPASALNVLIIPSNSGIKYFTGNLYLPLIISSNLVKISK
jgi:hypothetical protein